MDRYGRRLLLVALLLAAAALCASLPVAGNRAARTPGQPVVTAQQLSSVQDEAAERRSCAQVGTAQPAETEEAGFFVVLRTEAGRQVQLCSRTGERLQTAIADECGNATFPAVAPGRYRIESMGLGGEFCLWENASVTALSGTLWDDGELLHLAEEATVCLRLHVHTAQEQTGRVVTVTVTALDGSTACRSFVAGTPGVRTVEFNCLRPGDYRIRIGSKVVRYLTLTDEAVQEFTV